MAYEMLHYAKRVQICREESFEKSAGFFGSKFFCGCLYFFTEHKYCQVLRS